MQIQRALSAIALAAAAVVNIGCSGADAADNVGPDTVLLQQSRAQQPGAINTLRDLVNIETGTGDAEGMAQIVAYLSERLTALGGQVERHPPAVNTVVGDNIVARFRGSGTKNILVMGHMDTVYPRGTLKTMPFRIDGNRAYGPGILDMKGGIAIVLHAIEMLNARGFKDYGSITVFFNSDEEKGSFGSRDLIQTIAAQSDYVISLESTGRDITFLPKASGINYIQVDFKGRAAHVAQASAGVNALVEASDFVMRTLDINNPAAEIGFNWTVIKGGTPGITNAIPDAVTLNGDLRVGLNQQVDEVDHLLRVRAQSPRISGSEISVGVTRGRPAYNANEGGMDMIQRMIRYYKELGIDATFSNTRIQGGSDAAYAALSGKPVLENAGLQGNGAHNSGAEYVYLDRVAETIYANARLIMSLSRP